MKLFSNKKRPVHLGAYPLENLKRQETVNLSNVPSSKKLTFSRSEDPQNIVNAMSEYEAMLDVIRDGFVNKVKSESIYFNDVKYGIMYEQIKAQKNF